MTSDGRVIAVFDANVLYPAPIRDLLMRLTRAGLIAARWTERIHDEWIRSVLRDRPDLPPTNLQRTREMMDTAVPGALVEDYERWIPALYLPDPDDRHVLAAALETEADVIVTFNTSDFPPERCNEFGIEPLHPDVFVLRLVQQNRAAVLAVMREHRGSLRRPPMEPGQYLDNLSRVGLAKTVEEVRPHLAEL